MTIITNNAKQDDQFEFDVTITNDDHVWIIASAKNTQAYRSYRPNGSSVPTFTSGLAAELIAYVLRRCLSFMFDFKENGELKVRPTTWRWVTKKNNPPAKIAGQWQRTNGERHIISKLLEQIRQILLDKGIDGVNHPCSSSFLSDVISMLQSMDCMRIDRLIFHYKHGPLFNTAFGVFNTETGELRDARPSDLFTRPYPIHIDFDRLESLRKSRENIGEFANA